MTEIDLKGLAETAITELKKRNMTLSVAESCTGGWLSKIITDVSGASAVYAGGVCSYSNAVKVKVLGVKNETLAAYGAVSEQTANQMSQGVRKLLETDIGIGITGIAGPLSDGTNKPVGLIYISVSTPQKTVCKKLENNFKNDIRTQNRLSAAETALNLLGDIL